MPAKSASFRVVVVFSVVVCLIAIVILRPDGASRANSEQNVLPPITVTKTSVLVPVGDGDADPSETIEHTVVIGNGGTAATNVQFTDVIQSITTWGGMVAVSPIAVNDTYTSIGNVGINVTDGGSDLLGNDTNPGGGGTLVITTAPTTSAQGGNVSVNLTTGAFAYDPPPGFEGSDSFTYTLGNGSGLTDTATVNITVAGMIWFVQNGAPACSTLAAGCGRLSNPLSSLANFQALNNGAGNNPASNDNIFLYENAAAYTGGVTLLSGQKLIGQDSSSTLAVVSGVTVPPFSNPLPTMNPVGAATTIQNAAGNGVALGTGNTLNGFTASNSSNAAISGSGFGTVTVSDVIINTNGLALNLATGTFAGSGFVSVTSTGGTNNVTLSTLTGTVPLGSGALSGALGPTFTIAGGTAAVTYSGSISKTLSNPLVSISSHAIGNITLSGNLSCTSSCGGISAANNTSGTIAFSGGTKTLSTGGSSAVSLVNNTGTTINFSNGGLDIDTTSGTGFSATGGGTVNLTGSGNTISSTTGTALNLNGITVGAGNITFQSVSSNGGSNCGIVMQSTTGSPGTVIVTGTGTAASGGTIANKTGANIWAFAAGVPVLNGTTVGCGVYLNNATAISLTRMQINDFSNAAVSSFASSGFSMTDTVISGANGEDVAQGESALLFFNASGQATITGGSISGGNNENLYILKDGGTALNRFTVTGVTFGFNSTAEGNNSILVESRNAGTTLNFTLQSSTVRGARADWINVSNNSLSTGDTVIGGPLVADGNTFDNLGANAHPGAAAGGNRIVFGGIGNSTVDVRNNTTQGSRGEAIRIRGSGTAGGQTGTVNARVRNNTIGVVATANSGSAEGSGIFIFGDGGSDMNVAVTNNTIRQYNNHGISMTFGDEINDGSVFNATVTGNTVNTPGNINTDFNGIHLNNGTVGATDNFTTCADIGGAGGLVNNIVGSGSGLIPPNNQEFRLRQRQSTTVRLPGYAGANNNDAAVVAYIQGRNTETAGNGAASNTVPTGGGFVNSPGGAPCTQPSVPAFAPPAEEEISNADHGFVNNLSSRKAIDQASAPNITIPGQNILATGLSIYPGRPSIFAGWPGITEGGSNIMASGPGIWPSEPTVKESQLNITVEGSNITPLGISEPLVVATGAVPHSENAPSFAVRLLTGISEMISPTVYAQDNTPSSLRSATARKTGGELSTPEGAGDVNLGPFGIPANESVTIRFTVTVNNGPYASAVNAVTNTATVTADGGINQSSNTTSIPLDAAPDLIVTKTEGGGTTQPGVPLVYTLSYSNATATNGQNATNVVLTETVPANTTFNAAVSLPSVWSCADGSAAGTSCTIAVGNLAAGGSGTATFAVNVLAALPAGVIAVSNSSSIAENPNVNGTDRVPANNTGPDTTNIIGNWLGGTSTDWFTPANWSNSVVPPTGNNVSVPNVANQPTVTTADVTLNNMLLIGENVTINAGRTITVTGAATLGANIVNGPGTLSLGPTATITRTTGQVESTLLKAFSGPGAFTYPVGTPGGQFSPLAVNVTAGAGSLAVLADAGTAPATPPITDATALDRYWTLTETGAITADLLFTYLQPDVDGNENLYRVLRVNNLGTAAGFPNGSPCPGAGNPCVDATANTIRYNGVQVFGTHWTAGEAAPTAANATITGRVLDRDGRGLARSTVRLADAEGNVRYAMTNPFGYYRFTDVRVGEAYVIGVSDKRFSFAQRVINLGEDAVGVDFVPEN